MFSSSAPKRESHEELFWCFFRQKLWSQQYCSASALSSFSLAFFLCNWNEIVEAKISSDAHDAVRPDVVLVPSASSDCELKPGVVHRTPGGGSFQQRRPIPCVLPLPSSVSIGKQVRDSKALWLFLLAAPLRQFVLASVCTRHPSLLARLRPSYPSLPSSLKNSQVVIHNLLLEADSCVSCRAYAMANVSS